MIHKKTEEDFKLRKHKLDMLKIKEKFTPGEELQVLKYSYRTD